MKKRDLYIYLFPLYGVTVEEYEEVMEDYNLRILGINRFNDEVNLVVRGTKEELERFGDIAIGGYELHPDYLYKEDEFAGDILKLDENLIDNHIEYKGVDITIQHTGNLEEGEAGLYYFSINGNEYYCDYVEDCYKVIDAELTDGSGDKVWNSIYKEGIVQESVKPINEIFVEESDGWINIYEWRVASEHFNDLDYEIKNCVKHRASNYQELADEIEDLIDELQLAADRYRKFEERPSLEVEYIDESAKPLAEKKEVLSLEQLKSRLSAELERKGLQLNTEECDLDSAAEYIEMINEESKNEEYTIEDWIGDTLRNYPECFIQEDIPDAPGVCPHCGAKNNLEYEAADFEGEMMYFPAKCLSCGEECEEWYYMEFSPAEEGDEDMCFTRGECPHCHSENLNYDAIEFEGEMAYYPAHCDNCEEYATEWYYLTFSGMEKR